MQGAEFSKYFSLTYIVSLPERAGDLARVQTELSRVGFDDQQVMVPMQANPKQANGFASRAAHAGFLNHLAILKDISNRGVTRALVVEEDAIFRTMLSDPEAQRRITGTADGWKWAMWSLGHQLRQGLRGVRREVTPTKRPVNSAQCYGVHSRVIDDLIAHLSSELGRALAESDTGRADIGRTLEHFRSSNPEHICLVSNPALSIRCGSQSAPAKGDQRSAGAAVTAARRARDEFWRRTGIDFRSGR